MFRPQSDWGEVITECKREGKLGSFWVSREQKSGGKGRKFIVQVDNGTVHEQRFPDDVVVCVAPFLFHFFC
jgi:hypothetical protein